MRARRRTIAALGLGLLLCALLAACGDSQPRANALASRSPEQILAAAREAADGASTVHVAGSLRSAGRPLDIDLELVAGQGGRGRIAVDGLSIDVINAAGSLYVNGSAAFYRRIAGAAAARVLQGKWLKAPPVAGDFASLASLTDLRTLLDTTLSRHGALRSAGRASALGRAAVAVRDTSEGGTLYVAARGTPFPLEIAKGGSAGGRLTFDRWDEPVTISAPAGAINIKQLHA